MEQDNPYKRIFYFLYALRDEYALLLQYDKEVIKRLKSSGQLPKNKKHKHDCEIHYERELKVHTSINAEINALHASLGFKHAQVISTEMTSERMKDLQEFMDTILDIKNISQICGILKDGLISAEENLKTA